MDESQEIAVQFEPPQGAALRGKVQKLGRNRVVFELYAAEPVLRTSEVLNRFCLLLREQVLYSGRAVVAGVIQCDAHTVCEAHLQDAWIEAGGLAAPKSGADAPASFKQFLQQWGKSYRVLPEFKVVIADIQTFLLDLHHWLEQKELALRAEKGHERRLLEREWMEKLTPRTTEAIGALYERFDRVARQVEPDWAPAHQAFARRQIHPLILASPFVYRTLTKPLGYAGDYEMVNMMMRDPYEGNSLFAKAFNVCALSRPPIVAHRNRLSYLAGVLLQETLGRLRTGTALKVLNVGCGPAHEIRLFLKEQACADQAEFTLVDFSAETLEHVEEALRQCKRQYGRKTRIEFVRQSVQQMLKQTLRMEAKTPSKRFDLIYCAGLFDYLADPVCRALIGCFYGQLSAGGLLVVTNVDTHSSRNEMEYFLEWHLVYRGTPEMLGLVPGSIPQESVRVVREATGVNVFLEIRKPDGV